MVRIILSTLILAFHMLLSGEIIEAYNLDIVKTHLQKLELNPEALVLWDVDETLITPGDSILHPNVDPIRRSFVDHYLANKSREEVHWLKSKILNTTPFILIDPRSAEIIRDLQVRKIPVMALTAMQTGSCGIIPCMLEWRYNQLRAHSIDFSHFFPQQSRLEWDQMMTKWNRKIWGSSGVGMGHPVFYHGILASDGPDKGPVLIEFLSRVNWTPQRVIFIDNEWDYLLSVEKSMQEASIPFLGFHYRAIERHEAEVDLDLAHKQFSHLANHGWWLNDAEAKIVEVLQEKN